MLLMWRYQPNIWSCTCRSIIGKQWCNRYYKLQTILLSIISVTFFDFQTLARWNRPISRQQLPNSGLPRSTTSARRGRRNNINWRKTKITSQRQSNLHLAQLYHSQSLCFSYIQGVSKKRYFSDFCLISVLEVRFCFFTCDMEPESCGGFI